jgi:hypothetical protein
MKTPTIQDLILDKYDDRLRTIYDALDELKDIIAMKEFQELHKMYQDGALSGDPLEERVEMTYGDFRELLNGVKECY